MLGCPVPCKTAAGNPARTAYDSRGVAVEYMLAASKRCAELNGFRRTICGAGPFCWSISQHSVTS